jgi:hypothetical protein
VGHGRDKRRRAKQRKEAQAVLKAAAKDQRTVVRNEPAAGNVSK